jgi:hypothetical protein
MVRRDGIEYFWPPAKSLELRVPYKFLEKKYNIGAGDIIVIIYDTDSQEYRTRVLKL